MVIFNSTNTNKTKKHLSPYLTLHNTYEQAPLILNEPTEHNTDHDVWDRHKNVSGLNRLMFLRPSSLYNWTLIYNRRPYTYGIQMCSYQ